MNILPGLESTSSALAAEKVRLDIIGQNIANAHTTRGLDGKPYARQMVSFESKLMEVGVKEDGSKIMTIGVQVRSIESDKTVGALVYNPTHPDADENWIILDGEWEWWIEGQGTKKVFPNDIIVVPKNVPHLITCVKGPGARYAITKPDVKHIYTEE